MARSLKLDKIDGRKMREIRHLANLTQAQMGDFLDCGQTDSSKQNGASRFEIGLRKLSRTRKKLLWYLYRDGSVPDEFKEG